MQVTRRATLALAMGGALASGRGSRAADAPTVKVGTLQFGTVTWELDVIGHHGLDAREGFTLAVQGFGGNDAADVAIMGSAVDAIVEDWIWVSRLRSDGALFTFIPYSSAIGGLMVRGDSTFRSVADLAGRKIGIAGGALDKSWLILQAYARQKGGLDLAKQAEPLFAAPPLLNEKLRSGELDAVISYWNWCARLEAQGHRQLVGVGEAMQGLGVPPTTPQLGYVFHEAWANDNAALVAAFSRASRTAKQILATSDAEWERLRPLTKAEDDATLEAFKRRYRQGIVEHWGEQQRADAARLYAILAELGGERLVGKAATLAPGTFWPGVSF